MAQVALPAGCTEQRPDLCLYEPLIDLPQSAVRTFDDALYDAARGNHPVPFTVRYPVGVNPLQHGLMPVVIFNHGGGTTTRRAHDTPDGDPITHGQHSNVERGDSFARAGYVVFHIGRLPVQNLSATQRADCALVASMSDAACADFLGWHQYGPQNVAFLAQTLQQGRWQPPADLVRRFDPHKIVVGGWSGGSESGLNLAGAYQQFGLLRLPSFAIDGVVGYFLQSPRGPTWGGFKSGFVDIAGLGWHSFFQIGSTPMLHFSGRGDVGGDPNGLPLSRPAAWLSGSPGNKFLVWARQPAPRGPQHGTFNLSQCDGTQRLYCMAFRNVGVAYLDAVARQRQQAIDWMASDALSVMSRDWIELHRR